MAVNPRWPLLPEPDVEAPARLVATWCDALAALVAETPDAGWWDERAVTARAGLDEETGWACVVGASARRRVQLTMQGGGGAPSTVWVRPWPPTDREPEAR